MGIFDNSDAIRKANIGLTNKQFQYASVANQRANANLQTYFLDENLSRLMTRIGAGLSDASISHEDLGLIDQGIKTLDRLTQEIKKDSPYSPDLYNIGNFRTELVKLYNVAVEQRNGQTIKEDLKADGWIPKHW